MNEDAAGGGRPDVDVVVADRVIGDDAQLAARSVEQLAVDAIRRRDEQARGSRGPCEQLVPVGRPVRVVQVELERRAQLVEHARQHSPAQVDPRHPGIFV